MGANEKYEATYHGYTPNVNDLAGKCINDDDSIRITPEMFDRAIAKIRAEAKAEALDSLAQELVDVDMAGADEPIRAYDAAVWLRTRANQHKEQL